MTTESDAYRSLPSVDRLLADGRVAALVARYGHRAVADLARETLDACREAIAAGRAVEGEPAALLVERSAVLAPSLRQVVNATGIIVHTNLGRAPLAKSALEAMERVSKGYSNLEYDLEAGERGSRFSHLERLLCGVTGAEAAIAVNNNAAAVLLALSALCRDREVIISRGQLVEIGGGFRIPDVMRQSGATLVEVGTTNRTRLSDYADAISERTAAILRVHPSNFRIVGFTEAVELGAVAALARERRVPLIDDLGSGALLETRAFGLAPEPRIQDSVGAGTEVVLASGDKLIGGPQAGIAVGRRDAIERMRRHPLARAMRMDKATIAGLAATLEHYVRGDALEQVPVWRMIAADLEGLGRRARRWSRACGEFAVAEPGSSMVGGGSLPGETLPTMVCAVSPPERHAAAFVAALRAADPPVVARIEHERVLLDPRTVEPSEDWHVEATLARLCGRVPPFPGATPEGSTSAGR